MIFFVTSRQSYDQLATSSAWPPAVLWVAHGVLAPSELVDLRTKGLAVTDFANSINSSDLGGIEAALDTIREHHPGWAVWVDGTVAA
jgi:hypothetical protein